MHFLPTLLGSPLLSPTLQNIPPLSPDPSRPPTGPPSPPVLHHIAPPRPPISFHIYTNTHALITSQTPIPAPSSVSPSSLCFIPCCTTVRDSHICVVDRKLHGYALVLIEWHQYTEYSRRPQTAALPDNFQMDEFWPDAI